MDKTIENYHNQTKHYFNRYARSAGYLDWETQPHPFRYYEGASKNPLSFEPPSPGLPFDTIYDMNAVDPVPITPATVSSFFRYSLGLSAWKQYQGDRWPLRVNPSSGNLHPTEGYVILGPVSEWNDSPVVYHYLSEDHSLETRGILPAEAREALGLSGDSFLTALSSIHWREAWKYGERAFRYCQHDTGHALAALRFSAALHGWRLQVISTWSTQQTALLLGLNRSEDFHEGEEEEAELIALVSRHETDSQNPPDNLKEILDSAIWHGKANRLSGSRVEWPIIDKAAKATQKPAEIQIPSYEWPIQTPWIPEGSSRTSGAWDILLQRRSAQAFDGRSTLPLEKFIRILSRVLPGPWSPWDALYWPPFVNLLLFVHRVDGLPPGLYMLIRNPDTRKPLRKATKRSFLWCKPDGTPENLPLFLLENGDATDLAAGLSCQQEIAGDSFFSLGMLANFSEPVETYGPWFYRNLFWETGVIGQILYLEAEAAGARGTGIGCYFDDPVHELLGLKGNTYQSLYHFTVGIPLEDTRLTTLPGYDRE